MAGPYLMSPSTPAFWLCPYWKQHACIDAIWLPAQKKGNKLVRNNGYKQHFATDTDKNKITTNAIVFQSIFIGCIDYYLHFKVEVWKSNPVRLLAPWVYWLARVAMWLKKAHFQSHTTHNARECTVCLDYRQTGRYRLKYLTYFYILRRPESDQTTVDFKLPFFDCLHVRVITPICATWGE